MSQRERRHLGPLVLLLLGVATGQKALSEQKASPPVTSLHRDIVGTEKKLYSQGDEEIIVRDFFQDRRDGVFLDVGGAWPVKNNNTFYLEDQLGWWGIAVDALAEYAKPWGKRRNSKFFNYIVTDHSDTVESFFRADATGVSSLWPTNPKANGTYKEVRVATITLTKLLDQNHVKKVDFVNMDIEEAEPLALAGFDIERFKPDLLCVEVHPAIRDRIAAYFSSHGYERIERYLRYDQVNYYYTPKAH